MSNSNITPEKYSTQTTLSLEVKEEATVSKKQLPPTFKPYDNHQSFAIFDVQDLIPEHHIALVEAISDAQLFAHYTGGGRSSYHPKMMLKVILYAYSQKVYACRGIEKMLRENLPAMWLAAPFSYLFSYISRSVL